MKTQAENENLLAYIIRELSGDWVVHVDCHAIQHKNRKTPDEVIYFGKKADLQKGGAAEVMTKLSIMDRYNFDEQRAFFGYNEDIACREAYDLETNKSYIGIFNGEDSVPDIMTFGEDDLTVNQMNFALTTNIVKGTPKWGQRAFSAFFDWKQNGIIYYLPEIKRETIEEDWRITLMVSVKDWMQQNPSLFLPIVQAWD